MDYTEIKIQVSDDELRSLLIAQLEAAGYESFVEEEDVLIAYITEASFDEKNLKVILGPDIHYGSTVQQDKNWNEEWEKNYASVVIAGRCHIRAPFHPERTDLPLEIIIEPKMAFGTAHHATTALMIEWAMETDLSGKNVLDMGCGTGILAILANKLGASGVMAVDNDEWAYHNSLENVRLNAAESVIVVLGDASEITGRSFAVIFANINRNILLADMSGYASALEASGELFLSGFYENDIPAVASKAEEDGLILAGIKEKDGWVAVKMRKTGR